ncbi:MAG: hypothetical protein HXY41_01600 [Chloroflexi bacterium]|nr:hypothetical protein [Chloroflexota bacterium]
MNPFSQTILYYGSPDPLPEPVTLQAGPLTLTYEDGSLRYIRLGSREVLRQIYAAVRDHNWGTVPGSLSDVQMDVRRDSFAIRYRSEHRRGDLHFVWTGALTGAPDGTITFEFDGQALSTFRRNRIGFCVLHPMTCAGQPCTIEDVNGHISESAFPLHIAPHQPFFDLRAITHEVAPGVRAEVRMEGDTFEMEDQRNWTDASFKTYCTPLELPFPVTVEAGTVIRQAVTLRLIGSPPALSADAADLTFTLSDEAAPLPPLGLGIAGHGQPLTDKETARLKALNLAHLRADVRPWLPDWVDSFRQAAAEAAAISAALEIALHLTDNAEAELTTFRALLDELQPAIARILVFRRGEKSTRAGWVNLVRQKLDEWAKRAPVGAGTDAFFTELNRERPPVDEADFVTYSLNGTVHAVDNASVTETLATQAETVRSARAFANGLPVVISPVTFKMRWNPNATAPEPATPPGELPPQVDARQMSLYGAGWTVGSIKYLAESGAASLTYYETTGWRGVMETAAGSPAPDKFRSIPGGVFPMYHVFADVGELRGGQVIAGTSSDLLIVDGLALRKDGRTRLLLVNFTRHEQAARLPGLAGMWRLQLLDETSAENAMRDPEGWRAMSGQPVEAGADGLGVRLPPFGLARLDSV